MKKPFTNILVIRTDRIGDVLLSTPAMRALRETFSGAHMSLLTSKVGYELLANNPLLDEVMLWKRPEGLNAFIQWVQWLRKRHYDLVVIMNPDKLFHAGVFLAGIPCRVGYARKWGFLLTHTIKDEKHQAQKHEIEYNLDLIKTIGAETCNTRPSFVYTQDTPRMVEKILDEKGLARSVLDQGHALIAVHPGTSNPHKRWDAHKWAELLDMMSRELGKKVCIIGSQEEAGFIKMLKDALRTDNCIDLTGVFTLSQLGCFLEQCVLLVSHDSGPVHIAASLNVPTVVLFAKGVEGVSPLRWGPYGKGHTVIWGHMQEISPQKVLQAIREKIV